MTQTGVQSTGWFRQARMNRLFRRCVVWGLIGGRALPRPCTNVKPKLISGTACAENGLSIERDGNRCFVQEAVEHRLRAKSSEYRWFNVRCQATWDEAGHAVRIIGSQRDMTVRKLADEKHPHEAFHDELTELPNRALLLERVRTALQRSNQYTDYVFAVLFLDIDRFKIVNDSLGHDLGNQLLVEMGQRLQTCVRHKDTVGRLGGDDSDSKPPSAMRSSGMSSEPTTNPSCLSGAYVSARNSLAIAPVTPHPFAFTADRVSKNHR